MAVFLVIEGEEVDADVTALDYSQHGMRLQSDISLTPGQPVGILLSENLEHVLGARVVWAGKIDSDKACQAGLEFERPLPATV